MAQSTMENKISLAFEKLTIRSENDFDHHFDSIIKTFKPIILFTIDEVRYKKKKANQVRKLIYNGVI